MLIGVQALVSSAFGFQILFDNGSFGKVGHRASLDDIAVGAVHVYPVIAGLFQLFHSFFKEFLVVNELLNFQIRVFASEFFQNLESLSEVLVLVLKLKDFSVLLVNQLRLLLNSVSEA